MATHALDKLKMNLSGLGHLFGAKAGSNGAPGAGEADGAWDDYADGTGYDDRYDDDPGYDGEASYDDGYDQDYDDGYDDGYDDDPGYDDRYDDDSEYGDQDYDDGYDDGYDSRYGDGDPGYDDDGYYDDGYDDGYGDDGYDDRYSDEDAGDGYNGYNDGYGSQSPLMQYIDDNDWVTYLLLFLVPPLGIYLLWRRNRFDRPLRLGITAASAIWFIVLLILIFTNILGNAKDDAQSATINLTTPTLTEAPSSLGTEGGTDDTGDIDVSALNTAISAADGDVTGTETDDSALSGDTDDTGSTSVEPSPTPLTTTSSAVNVALNSSDYVYSPATGIYYHSKNDCTNIDSGVSVSRVPKEVAENSRKQSACPVCMATSSGSDTTTYYATRGGSYYHVDQYCSGMTGAVPYTKEAAERAGKTECPVCIKHIQQSVASGALKFVNNATVDKSNINVYYTKGGKYYHMTSDCSGMTGATRASLKDAIVAGKTACPTCCNAAGIKVYCTSGGTYYHQDKTCSGMSNAAQVTLAEAMVLGKTSCPKCIKGSLPTAEQMAQQADAAAGEAYVYGTPNGQYYHTNPTCSGMTNAQRYTLKSMLLQKRAACPVCASASDTVVYASEGGTYYHSYATCSGMTNAQSGTLAQALAYGYKKCPKCWANSGGSVASATSVSASSGTTQSSGTTTVSSSTTATSKSASTVSAVAKTATAGNTYVYATKSGSYYHINSSCSGMTGASRITLKQAIDAGKTACPTCASAANRTVYSTSGGKNYHAASTCQQSGMRNGSARTLAQALMLNQTACPYCMGKSSGGNSSSSASAAQTLSANTTTTTTDNAAAAKAAAAKKAAEEKAEAAKKLAEAKKEAEAKLTNSHRYNTGTSGIKVYASVSGPYYHRNSSCSRLSNGVQISLEAALNYGKTACPSCAATASRTVYATRGGAYYHYSKTHAGIGASSGTLASALAYGFKACPYCVTKTQTVAQSTNTYTSGTSGIKVYVTTTGAYYHDDKSCSGMTNPSIVSLETAMNYGKKPCPKCLSSASKTVYSTASDTYYHAYKAHAGSNAKSGTLAQALAMGKKACPACIKAISTGISTRDAVSYSEAAASTQSYSAPANTKVYINLTGSKYFYYHKASSCSDLGMSDGTKVTLQYAKDWGYKACPYCQPPTSIEETT